MKKRYSLGLAIALLLFVATHFLMDDHKKRNETEARGAAVLKDLEKAEHDRQAKIEAMSAYIVGTMGEKIFETQLPRSFYLEVAGARYFRLSPAQGLAPAEQSQLAKAIDKRCSTPPLTCKIEIAANLKDGLDACINIAAQPPTLKTIRLVRAIATRYLVCFPKAECGPLSPKAAFKITDKLSPAEVEIGEITDVLASAKACPPPGKMLLDPKLKPVADARPYDLRHLYLTTQ